MSNEERTGERNFLPLSKAAREVFGLRHQDVDLVQYCNRCKNPEVFIEATSSTGFKYTQPLRIIATKCDAPTVLIRHEWGDVDHEHPVDLYLWNPDRTGREDEPDKILHGATWDQFRSLLSSIHQKHNC